jgi:hypothetical protein
MALLAFSLLLPMAVTAKKDKDHNDAFMPGEPNEARIMKEVRHQLLQLPYYGVFRRSCIQGGRRHDYVNGRSHSAHTQEGCGKRD